jgi:hypothetical protein
MKSLTAIIFSAASIYVTRIVAGQDLQLFEGSALLSVVWNCLCRFGAITLYVLGATFFIASSHYTFSPLEDY